MILSKSKVTVTRKRHTRRSVICMELSAKEENADQIRQFWEEHSGSLPQTATCQLHLKEEDRQSCSCVTCYEPYMWYGKWFVVINTVSIVSVCTDYWNGVRVRFENSSGD